MKLSTKLMIMFSTVILIAIASVGGYSAIVMNNEITHLAEKKLITNEAMAKALLDEKYPGEWEIKNSKLFKGNTLMEDNSQVVDSINKLTGDSIVIFRGEISIAATIDSMSDGEFMVSLEEEVQDTVLKKGESYIGSSHDGKEISLYEPIKDKQGEVIGVFHVGMPKEMYVHASKNFRKNMFWIAVSGLILSLILALTLSIRFVKPITQMTKLVEKVSNGDFRVGSLKNNSKDELGMLIKGINKMVMELKGLIYSVQDLFTQVQSSSVTVDMKTKQISQMAVEVNSNVRQVETGASRQAKGMDASTVSAEEISRNIQQIADTTASVALSSNQMLEQADQGNQYIQIAVKEIQQLDQITHQMAESINELNQKSEDVGNIAAVISGISAQTHLLAMNAAIEAARAGEHGKGFTVVANEVKKLAEQSERSSHEIRSLIETVHNNTDIASKKVQLGLEQLDRGIIVLNKASQSFTDIVNSARVVAQQNQEVSGSTQEISAGSQEIMASIQAVNLIANETVTSVQNILRACQLQVKETESIAVTSSDLLTTIEEMRKATSQFQI